jgi:hypothetical protein
MYTMLDWPGLLTSIVTVFFVALGSVGETVHKLTALGPPEGGLHDAGRQRTLHA